MDRQTCNSILSWFHGFVRDYADEAGSLHPLLRLKLDHSLRVAAECRAIAGELGWPEGDVMTAEIVGTLHDVGRFPQFAKYRTFFDPSSLNHGACGYATVLSRGILQSCPAGEAEVILDSIQHHNCRRVPVSISAASLPLLKLIRDADKLDILYVVNDTIKSGRHKEYPEILLNIDLEGPPTPALVTEILETRGGSYQNVKTLADVGLMRLSWVYDVNYSPTFRRMQERRLLEDLLENLPDTAEIRAIVSHANEFIAGKLMKQGSHAT